LTNKAIIQLRKEFIDLHHPTDIITQIGGNGLAAVYEFPIKSKVITIPCKLDALLWRAANTYQNA